MSGKNSKFARHYFIAMVKIFVLRKTTKTEGTIRLRFRLVDGRTADLTHKSDIMADLADLEKFDNFGNVKPKLRLYNKSLAGLIENEKTVMKEVYDQMRSEGYDLTGPVFEELIMRRKNPQTLEREHGDTLLNLFQEYADNAYKDGLIGENRHKHIIVVKNKLARFLYIIGRTQMTPREFDSAQLMAFRDFMIDEYQYVKKYPELYEGFTKRNLPTEKLGMNTVVSQLKMLHTFISNIDSSLLDKSPFDTVGKERKKSIMKTLYDEPIFLRKEELLSILNNQKIPGYLLPTRDAFLLQCAFGCRISDFSKLSMDNVSVSEDGIPYLHYLPEKTKMSQDSNLEICTPIIRYAFDIIKRTNLVLPETKYASGENGYNAKIKLLLKACKITRKVPIFNEEKKTNDYVPICELGSSKLCRKTHVDMMNKVQVNLYAAGLHKEGSSAVKRYTNMELKDRFALMNVAFSQEEYKVDENLNII